MSDQQILIYDDLVPSTLRKKLSLRLNQPIWQFGWRSNVASDKYCYWHSHFAGGGIANRSSCATELKSLSSSPIYELWQILGAVLLQGHEPLRIYANAHTFGAEGYCHKDNENSANYFSTIYYAHSDWDKNWGGELIFYDSNNEIVKTMSAKPGRIVHFPGHIIHKVSALTKECPHLRISLVFKTQTGGA